MVLVYEFMYYTSALQIHVPLYFLPLVLALILLTVKIAFIPYRHFLAAELSRLNDGKETENQSQ